MADPPKAPLPPQLIEIEPDGGGWCDVETGVCVSADQEGPHRTGEGGGAGAAEQPVAYNWASDTQATTTPNSGAH
ncbi:MULTISPECIES: hypothetical protein [Streptomyces]|uniref:hypothetical protein n=1 Tax=Streptomyces TaxID=1883 RepID=UPI00324325EF